MNQERIQAAESLLKEAVYQARARQAAGMALGSGPSGGCGLGEGPGETLELSPRGQELMHELWPRETPPTEADRIGSILEEWVELQDAYDRKRNHYLRDFRKQHGFDRRSYSRYQAREFDEGLERINAEENLRLREAAEKLLEV